MGRHSRPQDLAKRGSIPLLTVIAADSVGMGLILPVLPYLAHDLGADAAAIGGLFAAYSFAQFCAAPAWGMLADRFAIKPLIRGALLVTSAGHLIFGFCDGYWLLFAGRIIAGLGAGTVVLVQAHIVTTTPPALRAARFGHTSAVQGFGTIIGPVVGAALIGFGHRGIGLAAAAIAGVAALLALAVLPEGKDASTVARPAMLSTVQTLARTPAVWSVVAMVLAAWVCFAGYGAVLPIHLEARLGMTSSQYGYVVAVSGVVALTVRGPLMGKLVRAVGEVRLIAVGFGLLALSMLLAPLVPSVWWAPILPLTYATGAGMLFPCLLAQITHLAPTEMAGAVLGGTNVVATGGRVIGPVALGVIAAHAAPEVPFYAGAAVLALASLLVMALYPTQVRRAQQLAAVQAAT